MTRRLVVEADGGSRGNPGEAAYGALVRDPATGEILAEVAEAIGIATNNVAEYRGVIAGLRAAREVDPAARVEVRLDSQLLVEQLTGNWKVRNADLRPLAEEARRVLPAEQVSYRWVPREQNIHADRLVNQALDGDPALYSVARPQRAAPPEQEPSPATLLLLVRHGRTPYTVERRYSGGGPPGPPLDDVGRKQASWVADQVAARGADAVVSSPTVRCRQTAEIIAERLGVPVAVDADWREHEFGQWEGLTPDEVAQRFPEQLAAWRGSETAPAPDGESRAMLASRVRQARDRVLERYSGRVPVVVTHSMPIKTLVCLALGAPLTASTQVQPAPGSLTEFRAYADGSAVVTGLGLRP